MLCVSKEVLWSWAWMAYQSPNPHPTTPPIIARWLSHRQFLGQTTLIFHHSFVNEVVNYATDNQIIWSWHLLTVRCVQGYCVTHRHLSVHPVLSFSFLMNNRQQGTRQTHRYSHLQKHRPYVLSCHVKCFHSFNSVVTAQFQLYTAGFVCT